MKRSAARRAALSLLVSTMTVVLQQFGDIAVWDGNGTFVETWAPFPAPG
jgi:D-serine deaminase-like pyridoxal phosphate-dependent protein